MDRNINVPSSYSSHSSHSSSHSSYSSSSWGYLDRLGALVGTWPLAVACCVLYLLVASFYRQPIGRWFARMTSWFNDDHRHRHGQRRRDDSTSILANCWFCNSNVAIEARQETNWTCTQCGSRNCFAENGDDEVEIPEQFTEELNPVSRALRRYASLDDMAAASPTASRPYGSFQFALCDVCQDFQVAKLEIRDNFDPSERPEVAVRALVPDLDQQFPLCPACRANRDRCLGIETLNIRRVLVNTALRRSNRMDVAPRRKWSSIFFRPWLAFAIAIDLLFLLFHVTEIATTSWIVYHLVECIWNLTHTPHIVEAPNSNIGRNCKSERLVFAITFLAISLLLTTLFWAKAYSSKHRRVLHDVHYTSVYTSRSHTIMNYGRLVLVWIVFLTYQLIITGGIEDPTFIWKHLTTWHSLAATTPLYNGRYHLGLIHFFCIVITILHFKSLMESQVITSVLFGFNSGGTRTADGRLDPSSGLGSPNVAPPAVTENGTRNGNDNRNGNDSTNSNGGNRNNSRNGTDHRNGNDNANANRGNRTSSRRRPPASSKGSVESLSKDFLKSVEVSGTGVISSDGDELENSVLLGRWSLGASSSIDDKKNGALLLRGHNAKSSPSTTSSMMSASKNVVATNRVVLKPSKLRSDYFGEAEKSLGVESQFASISLTSPGTTTETTASQASKADANDGGNRLGEDQRPKDVPASLWYVLLLVVGVLRCMILLESLKPYSPAYLADLALLCWFVSHFGRQWALRVRLVPFLLAASYIVSMALQSSSSATWESAETGLFLFDLCAIVVTPAMIRVTA